MIVSIIGILCVSVVASTLLTGLNAVYKAEPNGSASLLTDLYSVYKGESNANDSLGLNNGTANGGLTYVVGKSGNAFQGNGSNAYVKLGDNSWKPTNFSYCGWFKMDSAPSGACILSSWGSSATGYNNGLGLYVGGGALIFQIRNSGTTKSVSYSGISIGTPYFFSIKFDGTTMTLRVMSTGVDQTRTLASTTYPSFEATQYATIGAYRYGSADYPFPGWIDEIYCYSRAITISEETELYNSGTGTFYQNNAFYSAIVNDSLGNHNGVANSGVSYVTGASGNAFDFNGTTGYLDLGINNFQFTADFSISFWMYPTTISGTHCVFITDGYSNPNERGYRVLQRDATLELKIYNNTTTVTLVTGNVFSANTMYHCSVVHSSTGNKIYINGSLSTSDNNTTNAIFFATTPTYIGKNEGLGFSPNSYFAGKLDEIYIYSKALTVTEVLSLYSTGTSKYYPFTISNITDSDAEAFITAAAITDVIQKDAITQLVINLKSNSLWSKFIIIYPIVGGTAASHRFNLKSPGTTSADFYLEFNGGWTHSPTGALPSGTNGYANTKFVAPNYLTSDSVHFSKYNRTNILTGSQLDGTGGTVTGSNTFFSLHYTAAALQIGNTNGVLYTPSDTRGFFVGTRQSNSTAKLYRNNSLLSTDTTTVSKLPNEEFYLGAYRNGFSNSVIYNSYEMAFASLGSGLSDSEVTTFNTIVTAYQTALGRNV